MEPRKQWIYPSGELTYEEKDEAITAWNDLFNNSSISLQGATRLSVGEFRCFLRYPRSAYVQYASVVCLVNSEILSTWGRRVNKRFWLRPCKALERCVLDVHRVKVTQEERNQDVFDRIVPCTLMLDKQNKIYAFVTMI